MKIIKTKNKEYRMTVSGLSQNGKNLSLSFFGNNYTAEEIYADFAESTEIKITDEEGQVTHIFSEYGKPSKITSMYNNDAIEYTVFLEKNSRLDALENAVDLLTQALLEERE